jgi:hypothetical protein
MIEAEVGQTIEGSTKFLPYFLAIVALMQVDYFQRIIVLVLTLLMRLAKHYLILIQKVYLCCLSL